jgi:hypothetical protein
MKISKIFVAGLLLVPSMWVGGGAASGDDLSNQKESGDIIQPSMETGERTSALRDLAVAISSGSAAMAPFHGSQSEDEENKDNFIPSIPGMQCYIDRILNYVSCYSSPLGSGEAGDLFTRLIFELKSALPADRWARVKREPVIDSIQGYLYEDQKSDAHIDIDVIAQAGLDKSDLYIVSLFAWTY